MVVFFDLDGTLTDPFEGITRSVQFALAHFGIDVSDRAELAPYIGPPLRESFIERHGLSAEQADEALRQYRVRFPAKRRSRIFCPVPDAPPRPIRSRH